MAVSETRITRASMLPPSVLVHSTVSAGDDATPWRRLTGVVTAMVAGYADNAAFVLERTPVDPEDPAAPIVPVGAEDGDPSTSVLYVQTADLPIAWYRLRLLDGDGALELGDATDVLPRLLDKLVRAFNGASDEVWCDVEGDTLVFTARAGGVDGNAVGTTTNVSNWAFGGTDLAGGADALAAEGLFTIADEEGAAHVESAAVTIGGTTYTVHEDDSVAGWVLAGEDNEDVRDNLAAAINGDGAPATALLEYGEGNAVAGQYLRVGAITYVFVVAKTEPGPTIAIGGNAGLTRAAIIGMINGGDGLVPPNPDATAETASTTDILFTSRVLGAAANVVPVDTSLTAWVFGEGAGDDGTMAGGGGPGVDYDAVFAGGDASVTADTDTPTGYAQILVAAKAEGAAGNLIGTESSIDGVAEGAFTTSGAISAGDRLRIGSLYYQWAADPSSDASVGSAADPFLVLLGAGNEDALANMLAAVNASGEPDVTYSATLVVNPDIEATESGASSLVLVARRTGSGADLPLVVVVGDNIAGPVSEHLDGGTGWGAPMLEDGADTVRAVGTLTVTAEALPDPGKVVTVGEVTFTFAAAGSEETEGVLALPGVELRAFVSGKGWVSHEEAE